MKPDEMEALVSSFHAELENPPAKFKDPVSLCLMDEPVVISTGHVFDRATVYDEAGRFRWQRCPMTRHQIEQNAYPVCFLKDELVQWKLEKLDEMLDAISKLHNCSECAQLLMLAAVLLNSLGPSIYLKQTRQYYAVHDRLRERGIAVPNLCEDTDTRSMAIQVQDTPSSESTSTLSLPPLSVMPSTEAMSEGLSRHTLSTYSTRDEHGHTRRVTSPMMGDCYEVRDVHGVWSTARLICVVVDARAGLLALLHPEGWSANWLMWLSPRFDGDRIRPLSTTCPGIGSGGADDATSLSRIVDLAHREVRLCLRESLLSHGTRRTRIWQAMGGTERTYPFRAYPARGGGFLPNIERQRKLSGRPFQTCHELAVDSHLCQTMCDALLSLAEPGGLEDEGSQLREIQQVDSREEDSERTNHEQPLPHLASRFVCQHDVQDEQREHYARSRIGSGKGCTMQ